MTDPKDQKHFGYNWRDQSLHPLKSAQKAKEKDEQKLSTKIDSWCYIHICYQQKILILISMHLSTNLKNVLYFKYLEKVT